MDSKIRQLYDQLKLNRFRFAKLIGYDNSSVIAAERENKISKKMIRAICTAFPTVNPEWLKTGKGEMFVSGQAGGKKTDETSSEMFEIWGALGQEYREKILVFARDIKEYADIIERERKKGKKKEKT